MLNHAQIWTLDRYFSRVKFFVDYTALLIDLVAVVIIIVITVGIFLPKIKRFIAVRGHAAPTHRLMRFIEVVGSEVGLVIEVIESVVRKMAAAKLKHNCYEGGKL